MEITTELDYHLVIDETQKIIVSQLKNLSPDCHILFVKDRVDEGSITKIPALADELLEPEKAAIVKEAHRFLKSAVDELCMKYLRYAVGVGRLYGITYKSSHIDTESLATEALYKASIRFAPREGSTVETRKASFKAYISIWTRQTIQRSVPRMNIQGDDGTYYVAREVYTLDSALMDGEPTCHIDQITEDDVLWGGGKSIMDDKEAMEELRQKYCSNLSMDEMINLLRNGDENFIESLGA